MTLREYSGQSHGVDGTFGVWVVMQLQRHVLQPMYACLQNKCN